MGKFCLLLSSASRMREINYTKQYFPTTCCHAGAGEGGQRVSLFACYCSFFCRRASERANCQVYVGNLSAATGERDNVSIYTRRDIRHATNDHGAELTARTGRPARRPARTCRGGRPRRTPGASGGLIEYSVSVNRRRGRPSAPKRSVVYAPAAGQSWRSWRSAASGALTGHLPSPDTCPPQT